jgi:hypothetical protein
MVCLTGCWWSYGGGGYTPTCKADSLPAPALSTSSNKVKPGDSIVLVATVTTALGYSSTPCPNIKAVRFWNGDVKLGEKTAMPYSLNLSITPGQNGLPASGPNADVALFAQIVYDNPDGYAGVTSGPAFVRIDFSSTP